MITENIIRKAVPHCKDPIEWANALDTAAQEFGITTPARFYSFLAQISYESTNFLTLTENLHYTHASRLLKVFPSRFRTLDAAQEYIGAPEKLGNFIYANRLGNGEPSSGDGFSFRGRGLIQLTGRSNYQKAEKALRIDCVSHPNLLATKENAARSAAWFWDSHGLNELADDNTGDDDLEDFTKITLLINGGTRTVHDRYAVYQSIQQALA